MFVEFVSPRQWRLILLNACPLSSCLLLASSARVSRQTDLDTPRGVEGGQKQEGRRVWWLRCTEKNLHEVVLRAE